MPASCRIASLVPNGLIVESETRGDDKICLVVRAAARMVVCPLCASPSRRIHSRYVGRLSDLPCSGRLVRLQVVTRRFCCEASDCPRRIFAERFNEAVLPVRSRRTARLDGLVHHLGLALGGRPAASFAKRLMLPVSNDTLLRVVLPQHDPHEGRGRSGCVAHRRGHEPARFVCGRDHKTRDAVRAEVIEPWSNGQTEGQINKLKMVKRQMYGRAKIDLLEARLIGAV